MIRVHMYVGTECVRVVLSTIEGALHGGAGRWCVVVHGNARHPTEVPRQSISQPYPEKKKKKSTILRVWDQHKIVSSTEVVSVSASVFSIGAKHRHGYVIPRTSE